MVYIVVLTTTLYITMDDIRLPIFTRLHSLTNSSKSIELESDVHTNDIMHNILWAARSFCKHDECYRSYEKSREHTVPRNYCRGRCHHRAYNPILFRKPYLIVRVRYKCLYLHRFSVTRTEFRYQNVGNCIIRVFNVIYLII